MKTLYGPGEAKKRFQFYIPIPDFLSYLWMQEQESRIHAIARQTLAKHDVQRRSDLSVCRHEKHGRCIVVEACSLGILEIIRQELEKEGFYIEGGFQTEDQ
ncbi:MAG TPA: hypothetical protein VIP51_08690 [Eoetvoesiella sp.]